MKPRTNEVARRSSNSHEGVPNWLIMAGGVLLSALSARLGYKVKQAVHSKSLENGTQNLKDGKSDDSKNSVSCHSRSKDNGFTQKVDNYCSCCNGSRNVEEVKQQCNGQTMTEPELALVAVPTPESTKDSGVAWPLSPDRIEPPHKPFHHSNGSESPCVSESGSDIFSKREVIQKLRHQLKRRDDTILEMHDQITELQNSLNSQLSNNSHLQSLLDSANGDLFDAEREIQRLRKVIADHCARRVNSDEKLLWRNGYHEGSLEAPWDKGRGDSEKIDMLKAEINELKELMEVKDYLVQNYKEQKSELAVKIKELQERLDSRLPNIL